MASAPPASPVQRSCPPKIAQQHPVYSWRGQHPHCRVVYLRDVAAVERELSVPFVGHVGFDLEWRPNYVKGQQENPVAVVQLAGADRILLIQISAMTSAFTLFFVKHESLTTVRQGFQTSYENSWKIRAS